MSPKMHIFIVTGIVFVMFLAWQLMAALQQGRPVMKGPSPYAIQISYASYGENCKRSTQSDGFLNTPATQSLKNNALQRMNELCAGKPACTVLVGPTTFGDPAPSCMMKELKVEYRCFNVDRPWIIKSKDSNTLEINCENR